MVFLMTFKENVIFTRQNENSLPKYEPYLEFLIKEERIFRLGTVGRWFEWGESKNEDNE